MDSENSGSMQSSGGEEDYHPRAASGSSFNPFLNHLSPPPPTVYDPSTNISIFFNPPPQLQHQQITNPYFTPQSQTLTFHPHNFKPNETTAVVPSTPKTDQDQVTRNPKKRSRASRRAPTTVLTTDTSNFRAMVQEFTGIPAPPFTQSSTFPRSSRLDLFTTPSSIRSNTNITQPAFLRPLPQKLQPPRSSSNFFHDSNNINTILSAQSPLLFPNTSELGFLKLHQQLQNPNHSNSLHSSSSSSSIFGSKTEHEFSLVMPSQSNLKIGALEQFGQVNNAPLSGLPDLVSPENGNNYVRNSTNFRDGKTTTDNVSNSATRGTSEGIMDPWICSSD